MNRDELHARFDAWLDQVLEVEGPLEEIDAALAAEVGLEVPSNAPAPGVDLHALWSAMVVVGQEVKLQTREFRDLKEQVASARSEPGGRAAETDRRVERDAILDLIEAHDRLARGLSVAASARARRAAPTATGWLDRLRARLAGPPDDELVAALESGYRMALDHVREALARRGVREVKCAGAPFDPTRMNAVDLVECAAVEGTVLEVHRPGFTWNGEPFRVAEVTVAKRIVASRDVDKGES